MNVSSLLNKLQSKRNTTEHAYLVVQPDAIYFHTSDEKVEDQHFSLSGQSWESVLDAALSSLSFVGADITLVLSMQHYQTYQLDKPELPREEWSVGLPFLLKDLVTEKITEIVADAVELPNGNKIQAYVIQRSLLNTFLALFAKHSLTLTNIVPESEVWGHIEPDTPHFLLLQRSENDHFKVSAYVEHGATFQRAIRSVVTPLTGVASSGLQLDGLALELQRSVDYLSSQLKTVQINQLLICCDGEDESELTEELKARLNVKVAPAISGSRGNSGEVLAAIASRLTDSRVNLYPAHLQPKKEHFTLTNVAIAWGGLIVVMAGLYGFNMFQIAQIDKQLVASNSESNQLKSELTTLQEKLALHTPSAVKIDSIERMKSDLKMKRESLNTIAQFDDSLQVGYSSLMSSLATLGRNDVSISSITIDGDSIALSGLASAPHVVPNWIKQFKNEPSLIGRKFKEMNIGRNDDDVVTFDLTSKRAGKR